MVKIDVSKCIGCGICQNICPEGFEVIRRKAYVRNEKAAGYIKPGQMLL